MSEMFVQGLQLMGYGLLGVFTTLAVFIGVIHLLMKLFPARDDSAEQID